MLYYSASRHAANAVPSVGSPACLASPAAADQIIGQGPIETHAGIERHVVDTALKAFALVALAKAVHLGDVIGLEAIGVELTRSCDSGSSNSTKPSNGKRTSASSST